MVRRRSSPGSSSTTRMRALRLPVWFKIVSLAGTDIASVSRGAGFALIERALDVGDRREFRARLVEFLAQPRVLVGFRLQAAVGLGDVLAIGARRICLQPAVFRLARQMVVNLRKF